MDTYMLGCPQPFGTYLVSVKENLAEYSYTYPEPSTGASTRRTSRKILGHFIGSNPFPRGALDIY
jgi:hypothetical protein